MGDLSFGPESTIKSGGRIALSPVCLSVLSCVVLFSSLPRVMGKLMVGNLGWCWYWPRPSEQQKFNVAEAERAGEFNVKDDLYSVI